MAKYIALADTWLSHENRKVSAGQEFTTEFPKAKVNGELVPMKLGENLLLVEELAPIPAPSTKGKKQAAADSDLA